MTTTEAAREAAVRDIVTRVAHHIDARDWSKLRSLYAERVTTDYTSLFGGEVQQQAADALIETWRGVLGPLRATQHLLGPISVLLDGDYARAECHVRGYHYRDGLPGGSEWMVAGHYVFELSVRDAGWQIDAMTLHTYYQTGNRQLLEQAAQAR
ncbi:MAG TPA: nuclear transport factor 2 family protein [Polyangiaceae bacterium]|nr:nuclear transport factor 2 family protein [Polyangiaceae bacterium]